jgi:hypothetical protein
MKAIGFATQYYTLWDIETTPIYSTIVTAGGEQHFKSGENHRCTYYKNISTDIEKVKALYPDVPIMEDLRGKSRDFEYQTGRNKYIEYAPDVFQIGRNQGEAISSIDDKSSLVWSFDKESNEERLQNIEKQLNKIGYFKSANGHSWLTTEQKEEEDSALNSIEDTFKKFINGGTITINPTKNLDGMGMITIDKIKFFFPEYKLMSYGGFVYSLPTIKGIGKKIKGKTLELNVKTAMAFNSIESYERYRDLFEIQTDNITEDYYDEQKMGWWQRILVVESFKIL